MAGNQKNQKTAGVTEDIRQTVTSEGEKPAAGKPAAGKTAATEAEYTVEELTAAAHRFGVRTECVKAALQVAGVQKVTLQKAKEIIHRFMGREVR